MLPTGEMQAASSPSTVGRLLNGRVLPIPAELTDHIIDHCHDDATALASFSLISKAWLPRSRYHLFHRVVLGGIEGLDENVLFDLLGSPLSTISPFVRDLELYSCNEPWMKSGVPRMRCLVAVQRLHLYGSEDSPLLAQKALRTSFQQLTLLKVDEILFGTFTDFIDLICAYPLLEELVLLSSTGWKDSSQPRPSSIRRLPAGLHTLKSDIGPWSNHAMSCFFIWLRGQTCPMRILSLSPVIPSDIAPLGEYLRACGSSIHVLELVFTSWEDEGEDFSRHIDLSHNTGLRSLHLDFYYTWELTTSGIVIALSQIQSFHMEEIGFTLPIVDTEAMDEFDWYSLEKNLARPQFSCLQRIHIRLRGKKKWTRNAETYIRTRWQAHNTRGTLTFAFGRL